MPKNNLNPHIGRVFVVEPSRIRFRREKPIPPFFLASRTLFLVCLRLKCQRLVAFSSTYRVNSQLTQRAPLAPPIPSSGGKVFPFFVACRVRSFQQSELTRHGSLLKLSRRIYNYCPMTMALGFLLASAPAHFDPFVLYASSQAVCAAWLPLQ